MFPVVWVFFSLEHSIPCIGNGGDFCLMETEKYKDTGSSNDYNFTIFTHISIHSDLLRAAEREKKNGSNIYSF